MYEMKQLVVGAALMLCAPWIQAAPFLFTYQGQITSITSAQLDSVLDVGDVVTINVYADNGGTSAFSQTWLRGDTISADLTAGSYNASYTADWWDPTGTAFTTNGLGQLTYADWQGTLDSLINSDMFGIGAGVRLFGNGIRSYADDGYADYQPVLWQALEAWSDPARVPEPTTLALFGLGLAGLGAVRRKKLAA